MMRCNLIVSGLAVLAWRVCAAQVTPLPTIASPLQLVPEEPGPKGSPTAGVVAPLSLNTALYAAVANEQSMRIIEFPISPDLAVNLIVQQVETQGDFWLVAGCQGQTTQPLSPPSNVLLRGEVENEPGSSVFLGLSPLGSQGVILSGGERYIIATPPNALQSTVVYSLDDLPDGVITWAPYDCGFVVPPVGTSESPLVEGGIAGDLKNPAACYEVDIAIETDYEFTAVVFEGNEAAALNYVILLMGAISQIYQHELNVVLDLVYVRLWDTSCDPWNNTGTGGQLDDFKAYWDASMGWVQRDVAHMMNGRDLGGGTAYASAPCTSSAYSVSSNIEGGFPSPIEDNSPQNWDIFAVAHEIGHNFGTNHTLAYTSETCGVPACEDPDNNCQYAALGDIMSYCHCCPGGMANIALHIHPLVIDVMLNTLANQTPCPLNGGALCACGPGAGECLESHSGAGCDDVGCCQLICATHPECCSQQWDTLCAIHAEFQCAPSNDQCPGLELHEGATPFSTMNTVSSPDELPGNCNGGAGMIDHDLWYHFTPCSHGLVEISLCNAADFAASLTLFATIDGQCGDNELECSTSDPDCANLGPVLTRTVWAGDTYFLRVAGLNGAKGTGIINMDLQPSIDNCDGAYLDLDDGENEFCTIGASTDGPAHAECLAFGDSQVGSDIWYIYTATCTSTLTISTCSDADFDTRLAVYDGLDCPVTDDRLLGCNDDAAGCADYTSELEVPVTAGHDYLIRIGGYFGEQGTGIITLDCGLDFTWPDIDNDGIVGPGDLAQLLAQWGPCEAGGACVADLDLDGFVGPADLGGLLAAWSQ
jgi:hypothetical protein